MQEFSGSPEDASSAPAAPATATAAAGPSASAPAAPAPAAAAAGPSASAPAAARQAPCWVVAAPPERVLADMLRFAWSDSRGATMALAAARLALGVGLLAFTCWSFAEYSSAADFDDGLGGSFARTAVQLTNWALVVAVFFWLLAGAAQLAVELRAPPAPAALPPPLLTQQQQQQQQHDRRVRLLVAALWPAAFVLAAVADVLYWSGAATAGAARTTRLGSSIVKHTLLAPLALDLALARLPCAAAYGLFPLAIGAAYLAAAGVYALATRGLAGPYTWLNFRSGLTAAAVFVALAVGAAAFGALWALTRVRDRRAGAVRAKQKAAAVVAAVVAAAAAAEAEAGGGEREALAAA